MDAGAMLDKPCKSSTSSPVILSEAKNLEIYLPGKRGDSSLRSE